MRLNVRYVTAPKSVDIVLEGGNLPYIILKVMKKVEKYECLRIIKNVIRVMVKENVTIVTEKGRLQADTDFAQSGVKKSRRSD